MKIRLKGTGEIVNLPDEVAVKLLDDGSAEVPAVDEAAMAEKISEMVSKGLEEALAKAQKDKADEAGKTPEVDPRLEKKGEFKSFGEFLSAVNRANKGGSDNRLVKATGHSEGDEADGGFLVPSEYRNQLLIEAAEQSVVRQRAMKIPMKSDSMILPALDAYDRSANLYGGVKAFWIGEGESVDSSKTKFGKVKLEAKKLVGLTYASEELLADSGVAIEPLLKRLFGDAIAFIEDETFLTGNGVNKPLGILDSKVVGDTGPTITVARKTASEVNLEDIAKLYSRMPSSSLNRAVWVANNEVMEQLIVLGSGSGKLFWMPNESVAGKPFGYLLGRPIFFTEKVPGTGTTGDLGFYDFGYYLIGDRQSLRIDASQHVAFTQGETCWRFMLRVDGQPWIKKAYTPRKGSAKLSPFVALSDAA